MATAISHGAKNSGALTGNKFYIYDVNTIAAENLAKALDTPNAAAAMSISELTQKCELIIFAVKPNVMDSVLDETSASIDTSKTAVVSIAAGVTTERLKKHLPDGIRYLRIMPNTPMLCGCGATVFAMPYTLESDEISLIKQIFESQGTVLEMSESKISAVTALSGSGPAYAYMLIEAMADGGVKNGLTRAEALLLAAKTVEGSAKMVLDTGKHPAVLKDMVCSPGGTTIDGVAALEKDGFRAAVIDAVDAARKKADIL